jgi:ATP/maltotriose-dependent transcriptional regulator MalT
MKSLTADELLRRLERDVLLSTVGPRDLPERQQTMNATIAWSYQLLDAHEQLMFRRLGVLPGRFSIKAAAAVMAGPDDPAAVSALGRIAGLIDRSLLVRADTDPSTTRPLFLMLETVRAYATRQLDATGEQEDAQEGLARYCAEEAALATTGLVGLAQAEWLTRVQDDLENYRRALAWLIERGRGAEASGVASALMFFWLIRGHAPEGLRCYERILSLAELPPAAEVRSLIGAASMLYWLADHSRARSEALRGLALAHETADLGMVAEAEHLLGHVEYALGDIGAACDRFRHGLAHFRALAIPWGTGLALTGLAQTALATGDAAEAERLLDEAAAVLRGAGPWFPGLSIYIRAILAVRRSDPDDVIASVREMLARLGTLQDKTFFYSLVPLAAAAVLKGEHAWAARIFGARDTMSKSTGISVVDPSMAVQQQAAEREARAHLGPDRWAIAYAAGRNVSVDTLLKEIDEVLQKRSAAKPDTSGRT